jgi:hypothetical protein
VASLAAQWYFPMLVLHSTWRWVVIVALAAATTTSLAGAASRVPARLAVVAADLQLTFGLILSLWLSPLGLSALRAGDREAETLFFGAVHFAAMLLVVVLAHAGGISARRGLARRAGMLFAAALVIVFAAIPWWRPLIRI